MKKALKTTLKILRTVIILLLAAVLIYGLYVLACTIRKGDRPIEITEAAEPENTGALPLGKDLKAVTFNIGFGAYNEDFSFFMDGGERARAVSEEDVYTNMAGVTGYLTHRSADITLLQEVDEKGTRSHGINQIETILRTQQDKWSSYAENYHSAYLLYPVKEPIGANKSGLLTLSEYEPDSSERISLPIEGFPRNLLDLDRCYSKTVIPTDNYNADLIVYNLHLSAYTSDGKITNEQLRELLADMQREYDRGHYIIAGGDFNRDLLGNSEEVFGRDGGDATWAQPIPEGTISVDFTLCAPSNAPTCRDTSAPYDPENSFVVTLDGFIVSNNIEVTSCTTEDLDFAYSDHNPVLLKFKLKK